MNDMVMLELGTVKQVSDDAGIVRNLDADCVFNCPHRGQIVDIGADPA